MSDEITACSCTGIRSCLICNKHSAKESDNISALSQCCWFCPSCAKLFEGCVIIPKDHHQEVGQYDWCTLHGSSVPSERFVDGIHCVQSFVTTQEEHLLVKGIDEGAWKLSQSGRRKQDFGPKANFKKRKVKLGSFNGFPSYAKFLIRKLPSDSQLKDFTAVELCNLEYTPERGSSIDPHIDDVWLWGDQLVTVNLLGTTVLTLSRSRDQDDGCLQLEKIQVPLVRRSLLVLSGDARYKWEHAIKRQDIIGRRIAMTLRNLSVEILEDGASKDIVEKIQQVSRSFQGTVVL